jgi:hypothetical protein
VNDHRCAARLRATLPDAAQAASAVATDADTLVTHDRNMRGSFCVA